MRAVVLGARAPILVIPFMLGLLMLGLGVSAALAASAGRVVAQPASGAARVAVPPISGAPNLLGASLRAQIMRQLRGRGYRVVSSIPRVEGTGQYLALARDHRLAAFVVADFDDRKGRQTLTMLVWDGAQGSVLGRWSISGRCSDLGKQLSSGFWKRLGPVLQKARAPEASVIPPAPPMRLEVN